MTSPHGNIAHQVRGQIIINQPSGAFNREGVEASFEAILEDVSKHKLDKWYLVEHLGKDLLATPDAYIQLAECFKQCKQQGCQGIYFVKGGYIVTLENAQEAARTAQLPTQLFTSIDAAIAAINEL